MNNPLVTCIVPHHLDENHEYLKLCLDSILASEVPFEFEVICVADTKEYPVPYGLFGPFIPSQPRLQIYHRPDLNTASAKVNWAAKQAKGKYLWIISDDVMISKHAMRTMVEGMGENAIICNPMSNSDNGSQFWTNMPYPIKYDIADYQKSRESGWPDPDRIRTYLTPFLIPVRSFISFYCTMIPRRIWDLVGDLDEALDARHNDQDYCLRAMRLGVQPMINLGAFALHFGDKTLPKVTTPEMYAKADQSFLEKWK